MRITAINYYTPDHDHDEFMVQFVRNHTKTYTYKAKDLIRSYPLSVERLSRVLRNYCMQGLWTTTPYPNGWQGWARS